MEKQNQTARPSRAKRNERAEQSAERRLAERSRTAAPELGTRVLAAGGSLYELPPGYLEELAGLVGNDRLLELLERGADPPGMNGFVRPGDRADERKANPICTWPPTLYCAEGLSVRESPPPGPSDPESLRQRQTVRVGSGSPGTG